MAVAALAAGCTPDFLIEAPDAAIVLTQDRELAMRSLRTQKPLIEKREHNFFGSGGVMDQFRHAMQDRGGEYSFVTSLRASEFVLSFFTWVTPFDTRIFYPSYTVKVYDHVGTHEHRSQK